MDLERRAKLRSTFFASKPETTLQFSVESENNEKGIFRLQIWPTAVLRHGNSSLNWTFRSDEFPEKPSQRFPVVKVDFRESYPTKWLGVTFLVLK